MGKVVREARQRRQQLPLNENYPLASLQTSQDNDSHRPMHRYDKTPHHGD